MLIPKIAKQKMEVLASKQKDLYDSINLHFSDFSDEQKGRVAGFAIEAVIKSGGDVSIFEDEYDTSNSEEYLIN